MKTFLLPTRTSSFLSRGLLLIMLVLTLAACSNMRWGTSAGLDVRFGPNGPQVVPRMDVNVYSGGRF